MLDTPAADTELLDTLWVLWAAALVFVMQAGFLCLEAGTTRSKNAINVAMKNIADFAIAVSAFWLVGFGLMFGLSENGWVGTSLFGWQLNTASSWVVTVFIFQAMFCATAATIVAGAVAERMPFAAYLWTALWIALLIYPVFGHWAWGGLLGGSSGWLASLGFVDFAGSTVVHSVGGWVALAAVLCIGPRQGRFNQHQPPTAFPAGNLPLAMLGALFMVLGWFGFNGGSTLAANDQIPSIIANTILGAAGGILSAMLMGWRTRRYADVMYAINGAIAGLVAVTAGAHAISMSAALGLGVVSGILMVITSECLLSRRIDDAVGAIPAHLIPGIWGTLALPWVAEPAALGTGLNAAEQAGIQLLGVVVCGLWSFGIAWLLFRISGRYFPLRVSDDAEKMGLNLAEHGTHNELTHLLEHMRRHEQQGDMRQRIDADPFTEVGEIAAGYNRVAAALESAIGHTRVMLHNLRDGVITWQADGILTSLNPGAEQLFGVSAHQLVGTPVNRLLPHHRLTPGERHEIKRRSATQEVRYLEIQVSEGASGSASERSGMVRDITERKRLQEQLNRERDLARTTLASIGDGVITCDASGLITFINSEAQRLTGWGLADAQGKPIQHVYRLIDDITGHSISNPARRVLTQHRAIHSTEDGWLEHSDGKRTPIQHSAAPIRSRSGITLGAVVVFQDVSITRQLADQLTYQASHDNLTDLVNRRAFETTLSRLLESDEGEHVLCYLDLDQFKIVNDTCGHLAGDELLRQVAVKLQAYVRSSDTVARLGGDEFALLLPSCPMHQAKQIADAIRCDIEKYRFVWQEHTFGIGISIGLVALGSQPMQLSDALHAADAACYTAKEAGRNRLHCHQPNDHTLLERNGELRWVQRLQNALDNDHFRLYAQPIEAIGTQGAAYQEILLRLEEDGSMITPGSFLPAAERYHFMPRIDRWVVRNTLAWLSDVTRASPNTAWGCWGINLSGASLSDRDFCHDLVTQVQNAHLPAGCLCFEITESVAIAQLSSVIELIHTLKRQGCRFALDDFGTGLSSFSYLKQLPVDYLKIDGHFIRNIHEDPIDRAMVEAIHAVGKALNIETIAEFVETQQTLDTLKTLGIDYAQGFLLGHPEPLTQAAGRPIKVMPR
ncbi:ammonium transporter [Vreelandella arcis]|uniref:Ammonium transporter, Amt family n=1 Tax=Vreelandella arcis TaxID=416873 RepID=A0A1G9YLT6_9GAMM|nr:ammonium transporter [Halomonas arcis]SDN09465.1 ammonium transporter, Amt family [Halomonas arcis]